MLIKDLGIKSITDMSHDEAIEHLRQIRLNRRLPQKITKAKAKANLKSRAKKTPKISKLQAAELLKILSKEN